MLHASETWTPTLSNLHLLQRNNRAMIRWVCGVATKDLVSPQERSDGWLKKVQKLNPTGGRGRGGPKKTRTEVIDIYSPGSNSDPPIWQENLEW